MDFSENHGNFILTFPMTLVYLMVIRRNRMDDEEKRLEEVRESLLERDCEDSILLENPSFVEAIIGEVEGHVVYSYDIMVQSLAKSYMKEGMTEEEAETEAMEWISYNTIRAIPYMKSEGKEPYILYPIY